VVYSRAYSFGVAPLMLYSLGAPHGRFTWEGTMFVSPSYPSYQITW
jgi:hypothetical protein